MLYVADVPGERRGKLIADVGRRGSTFIGLSEAQEAEFRRELLPPEEREAEQAAVTALVAKAGEELALIGWWAKFGSIARGQSPSGSEDSSFVGGRVCTECQDARPGRRTRVLNPLRSPSAVNLRIIGSGQG